MTMTPLEAARANAEAWVREYERTRDPLAFALARHAMDVRDRMEAAMQTKMEVG